MSLFSQMELPKAAYSEDDQGVACVTLWRSVLDRHLLDAIANTEKGNVLVRRARTILKEQAREWLNNSEGFREVCYLAMLDHKWALDQVNNYVKTEGNPSRLIQREGAGSWSGPAQRGDNPAATDAGL